MIYGCLSLHGLDEVSGGADIQIGGLDAELSSIVLEKLTAAGIPAAVANQEGTNGNDLKNLCNKPTINAGVQLFSRSSSARGALARSKHR